jgi:hypothetical protein
VDDEPRNELDLLWSFNVGASIVDELLVAKLIREDQAEWARQIVSQDIHIKWSVAIDPQIQTETPPTFPQSNQCACASLSTSFPTPVHTLSPQI